MAESDLSECPACGAVMPPNRDQVSGVCSTCGAKLKTSTAAVLAPTIIAGDDEADTADQNRRTSDADTVDLRLDPTIERIGRFQLKQLLGSGGFGRVYRAFDSQLDRMVAIKLPTFTTEDRDSTERFLTEARAAARLKHPNIVTTYEVGKSGGTYFIATEYVAGQPMVNRIRAATVDLSESLDWIIRLARACDYAHRKGIVHRDIKPHNIMIDQRGEPRLMDFGLAKRMDDQARATADGTLMGTPAYMSPEQARGEVTKVSAASDQYSLGVVLFQLITGKTPVSGSPYYVISQVASGNLRSVLDVKPDAPEPLAAICQKAMHPQARHRYSSCSEFAEDLEAWKSGGPLLATSTAAQRWTWRRYLLPVVAACSFVIMWAVIFLFATSGASRDSARTAERAAEIEPNASSPDSETPLTNASDIDQPIADSRAAQAINAEIWRNVVNVGSVVTPENLQQMQDVARHFPNGNFLNTLGVAQYRAGLYSDAIQSLMKALPQNKLRYGGGGHPADPAFLALSHLRRGDKSAANRYLGAFVASMTRDKRDRETLSIARELALEFEDPGLWSLFEDDGCHFVSGRTAKAVRELLVANQALGHAYEFTSEGDVAADSHVELNNAPIGNGVLRLNGTYERKAGGFRAVFSPPGLNPANWGIRMRIHAKRPTGPESGGFKPLLVGGTSRRWFRLLRRSDEMLTLDTAGRKRFQTEIPIRYNQNHEILCAYNAASSVLTVVVDDQFGYSFRLLTEAGDGNGRPRNSEQQECWTFTDYSTGLAFRGDVDYLRCFTPQLTDKQWGLIANPAELLEQNEHLTHNGDALSRPVPYRQFSGWRCAWAPDSKRILYNPSFTGNELRIRSLRFGGEHSVHPDAIDARWSSTNQIVYTMKKWPDTEVWTMHTDGTDRRLLTPGNFPSWSGDGGSVYLHDPGSWTLKSVSLDSQGGEPVNQIKCRHFYPAVSPDEQRIAFGRGPNLVIADLESREDVLVYHVGDWNGLLPGWSPDGKYVAFGDYGRNDVGLWVLNTQSHKAHKVLDGNRTLPRFSPDGTFLSCEDRKQQCVFVYRVADLKLAE